MHRRVAVVAVLSTGLALALPTVASARDRATTALNVIPSGQYGAVPPPAGADTQAKMYDALTPRFGSVTTADLFRDFKSERLSVVGRTVRTERPRAGVRIVRDSFNVPHIYGRTHDDVTFGAGWVAAEDRSLLLEQSRYNARVAAIDAPGLSAIDLVKGLKSFEPSARTEAELSRQTNVVRAAGVKGRQLLRDIDVFCQGINAQRRSIASAAKPWARNDVYALNALKGQFLGQGGGDEARRSAFLAGLQQRLGSARGFSVFNDLRERTDPETPVSIARSFPYAQVPASRAGNAMIDAGSMSTSALRAARAAAAGQGNASNILIAAGSRSRTGHPMFVGGPQIGYFYPGLTWEVDLHGPGVNARGATSAPFPGYLLIGRGEDWAMTLTSAHADIIDQYVETLCGGSDHKYMYRGQCRDMDFFDAGVLRGTPDQPVQFYRTAHGPVVGYATVGGQRVAISRKRSSYGRDTLDQLFFQDLTLGRVHSAQGFVRAALQTPQTFNAFYADDRDAAMVTTGLLPLRPGNVDPGLPTKGTGQFEWRGFARAAQHPQVITSNGLLVNWNNQPAPGFQPADDRWAYGAEQRVQMLTDNLAARRKHDLTSVTAAMNKAATQDLRALRTLPIVAAVLRTGPAPSPRESQLLDLMLAWRARGASRLDRNLDGSIDDPGAAIMDRAWPKLANAAMSPVLGPQLDELGSLTQDAEAPPNYRFDLPPAQEFNGWHGYLDKDLRTLLGRPVRGRFNARYCGAGNLASCRAALWEAVRATADELTVEQGADPTAWRSDANRERLKFIPGLLPLTMRYANRPSGIQQVITFGSHEGPRR